MNCIFCKDLLEIYYRPPNKISFIQFCHNSACKATHFINVVGNYIEQSNRDYGNTRVTIYFNYEYELDKYIKNIMYIHLLTNNTVSSVKFNDPIELEDHINMYNMFY